MPTRHVHVITPGDHFSPSTGSAIPTVVHGLAAAAPEHRAAVVVAHGTYADRYDSADIIEYPPVVRHRLDRYVDAGLSRVAGARPMARREYARTVAGQGAWERSVIFAHNAPQLVPSIDSVQHIAVLYAHNDILRTYSPREAARVLDRSALIVCVSDALAGQLSTSLSPALRERLRVVHNGVDTEFFTPRADRVRGDALEVVFVGRVLRDKGPDVLIDAVRRLARPDVHLTVVGAEGFAPDAPLTPYERSLRLAAEPIADQITMLPFVPRDRVAELLRSADVVVVPSRWQDPFPLTVLEGMASGAAVIASDIGGIPEAAGEAGILVAPGDVDALAGAIAALADDQTLLSAVSAACLRRARANSWAVARERLDTVVAEFDRAQPA
ncbi:MAG: glycosyltransferase family 1 protein [Microbacteriaceae bacterium]|nr:MAG: glycosyltransferase family 1 protein [Microbacteriaceae bacterium]